ASTGSTMLSPCWSRKNVCSPNNSLSCAITGSSSGITRASNCPKVCWTCAELSFIAHSFFRFAQRRRHSIIAGCGPPISRWSNATYALCVYGQVTTIELNEPVAPEFRNILPDELCQTVEKLFRSSRHVFSHATLSTCHACLISENYWDQRELGPTTYLTFDPAFRDALQRRQ